MRYILCLFTSFLFSCTSKNSEETVAKPTPVMEETFPFSEADRIEVISYPVRYMWDTIREGKKTYLAPLVVNKKLVDTSGFKERIFLDEKQKEDFFNAIFIRKTNGCEVASCFNPRHAILFYSKSDIIADMEICFECGQDRGNGFKYNELCYEGLAPIGKIFKEAGIKYFGEGE